MSADFFLQFLLCCFLLKQLLLVFAGVLNCTWRYRGNHACPHINPASISTKDIFSSVLNSRYGIYFQLSWTGSTFTRWS